MKEVDCIWELKNLGERVVELQIEKEDSYQSDAMRAICDLYQYVVVKVPMNMFFFNDGLAKWAFL